MAAEVINARNFELENSGSAGENRVKKRWLGILSEEAERGDGK